MKKPNVLFIFTDQQALRAMSAYGNPYLHTPHMDSIAANGVRFEKSYCTSPVCCPSRSSLVTSRMPHETGINVNGQHLRPGIPIMGEIFRDAGYETAWTGKWHVEEPYALEGVNVPGCEVLPFQLDDIKLRNFGAATDGPITDRAVEFIRRKHDRPFFLGLSYHNPHDICAWIMERLPFLPDIDMANLPPLPANFAVDPNEPEFIKQCRRRRHYGNEANWTVNWDETRWRIYLSAYYRFTERVDQEIGSVLTALREEGLEEDTLIIFTSDHGEGAAAHKWVVKLMLFEEPVTVPFIVRWKGVTPAGVVDRERLVSGLDVLPTMCDYAGIEPLPEWRGISLKPLIENAGLSGRDFVVSELSPDTKDLAMRGRMVRTARYKYVVFSKGQNPEMLFDLENDPGETQNLAHRSEYQEQLNAHRRLLEKWIDETEDDFCLPLQSRP